MKPITAFKEHKEFQKNRPWSFWQTSTGFDAFVTPPHYAETIEILIFHQVKGDIYIDGRHFLLAEDQVFFIAPQLVHAMNYKASCGKIVALKINPIQLKPLLDLDVLLEYHHKTYMDLAVCLPEYEAMAEIAYTFEHSDDINEVLIAVLRFFSMLLQYSDATKDISKVVLSKDETLRSIIEWTEENCMRRLSLDEVSGTFGYTKHYFCQKFKKATGITYLTYLNTLRISRACVLLKTGKSVSEVCDVCGFEDTSYFIQLFKKITGYSPGKYARLVP